MSHPNTKALQLAGRAPLSRAAILARIDAVETETAAAIRAQEAARQCIACGAKVPAGHPETCPHEVTS